jgi:uncharacterized coiled-coil protein SlyX
VTGHPSPLDRLEARLAAQEARIDELYRLLQAAKAQPRRIAEPRRRPRRRRDRVAARP